MAEPKREKVTLASAVKHDGTWYQPGDTFEGDAKIVEELRRAGAVRVLDEAPAGDDNAEAAQKQAKEIVAKAEAQAEKIVSDAEAAAQKIVEEAEKRAAEAAKDAEPKAPAQDEAKADDAEKTPSQPAQQTTQAKTTTKSK
ncbi:hypothetical protein RCF27_09360 [Rhodococcus pyridinivorans]|uniref:DUF7210 family protein n=1 Tax=Rhodococcus pyridinivorans TaxID=103816 RepID=UPI00280BFE00|nr:hypothetical protein [Rhodococcus pyridinivorans]WMM74465.1 hypothetical protein RCF27_09360 [Rhodococcus pyridinivorans]